MAAISLRIASRPSVAQGSAPSPPALHTATASALPCTPAMGAWRMGRSIPRNEVRFIDRSPSHSRGWSPLGGALEGGDVELDHRPHRLEDAECDGAILVV